MGTLYRKSPKLPHWCYSYQLDGKKKVIQGKKNGLYGLGDITEKYKRSLLKQFNEEYENNKYNHYGERVPTIRESIDEVLDLREKRVNLKTLGLDTFNKEKTRMELFWDFLIDNYTPKQLSVDRLDETILKHYTDYCMTERGNSKTTIHNNHNVIRILVRHLMDKGYLNYNPYEKVEVPKPTKREKDKIPDRNDYQEIKDYVINWVEGYINGDESFSIIKTSTYIQVMTGMRIGEVRELKWKKGKGDSGEDISIRYVYLSHDWREIVIYFKKKYREVPISSTMKKLLKKSKSETKSKVYVLEGHNKLTKSQNKKYIGRILDPSYFRGSNGRFHKLLEEIGVNPDYTTHSLRHGFITDLVRKKQTSKFIGQWVGHSESHITETYTHLDKKDMYSILDII